MFRVLADLSANEVLVRLVDVVIVIHVRAGSAASDILIAGPPTGT